MRCYICNNPTDTNALAELDDEDVEVEVTDHLGLIHCVGTDEQFDEEGYVIVCHACVENALQEINADA